VHALLPDLGFEFLPDLVLHDHAEVGPDLGDDLCGWRRPLTLGSAPSAVSAQLLA
jgi:hypothetical protein